MTEKEGKIIAGVSSVVVLSLAILSAYHISREVEEENRDFEAQNFYIENIQEEELGENILPANVKRGGNFIKVYFANDEKIYYRVYDENINEYVIYELPEDLKKGR